MVISDALLLVTSESHNLRQNKMKLCVNTVHLSFFNNIIIEILLVYQKFLITVFIAKVKSTVLTSPMG